jgi:hypothetical protein
METNEAIMAFSQSEKIKSGLIWVSQVLGLLQGLSGGERTGAEKVIHALLNMVGHEIKLARVIAGHKKWDDAEAYIDKAVTMVVSGVASEAQSQVSKALSKITNIDQESMSFLQAKGLI